MEAGAHLKTTLKRNQAYRATGYGVKGRTSNKDEDLRRRLLEFKTEFERLNKENRKIQEENEQRIKGSVKEKELLNEIKKDPIVVAEIRRIVVSRRREGFKGLEQDKDSTRIKGQKSRRYRIKWLRTTRKKRSRAEEQDREAENRGVKNKRTVRRKALVSKSNNINNNKKKINKEENKKEEKSLRVMVIKALPLRPSKNKTQGPCVESRSPWELFPKDKLRTFKADVPGGVFPKVKLGTFDGPLDLSFEYQASTTYSTNPPLELKILDQVLPSVVLGSKQDISRLDDLRKEHQKVSKLKEEADERLKVLRSLKNEVEDDLFDLICRKTSMSRRTSAAGSTLPTRLPSISGGSTTDKRKISPTTYETVTQGSSIKPRTEHEELMKYPQPLQRLIKKIDNLPKDGDCGYNCVAWSSGQGRGISTAELIRKHLSAELKNTKRYIRNTQAGKSAGVAGWLKMPLFGYAIANHLRSPLYCFSLESMHTYVPTKCSYSSYPLFCMAFVDTNHYVVLHFKKFNETIPAPPIDGWWLRKSFSRNKNVWLQSLENDLKLFQKLMPSASGELLLI
ncbi:hypothetical protein PPACK8108_LOCUS7296 [Phakopsora pachyrhizi]|uniref:OTU domain-containing protein n=1 Tax=Phakopsora pachyrhizi TaxID=170000 RepID=A0AAV0AUK2_PHAPC|nr:hypothetical protein PPACK8108_LOCUS7296 [Phakopsora pachyrhizi]